MSNRNTILLISIVAALVGAVVLGSKKKFYISAGIPVLAETTEGPVRFAIGLDKMTYKLGEPVNVTLTIKNISNRTVFLAGSSTPVLEFVVYNQYGQKILLPSPISCPVVVSYPIEPGETLHRAFTWKQQKRIASYLSAVYGQVDVGIYFILVRTTPWAAILYDEAGEIRRIQIETPQVYIEVVPERPSF
ncbi:MAG: hypothetical protein OEX09_03340 [Candidatus Bathyarchaeota archaeon]|nr:hypothetical protein [Candidatus Bathyarchaeota archaeon]MDH5732851.1 hypothetical protein [Candidatus Bathyarchaeota archaeon]